MDQKAGEMGGGGGARQTTAPAGARGKQQGGAWGWKRERVIAEEVHGGQWLKRKGRWGVGGSTTKHGASGERELLSAKNDESEELDALLLLLLLLLLLHL